MAEAIYANYGKKVQIETHLGSGGIFDVAIDGELVFRKWDEGRFPGNHEILDQIAGRLQKA